MKNDISIRIAELEDAKGIAEVNIETWRSTYQGIMPDSYLCSLSLSERTAGQQTLLAASGSDNDNSRFIAQTVQGRVVGYGAVGKERTNAVNFESELFGLYVLPEYHGKGIGRALTRFALDWLKQKRFRSLIVWVIEANPIGRRFYESLGGHILGINRTKEFDGHLIREVAYGWENLLEISKILNSNDDK